MAFLSISNGEIQDSSPLFPTYSVSKKKKKKKKKKGSGDMPELKCLQLSAFLVICFFLCSYLDPSLADDMNNLALSS